MSAASEVRSSTGAEPEQSDSLAPEDSFLVQIRGGSRLDERSISGRVEYLRSGESEQFGSLAELLDFVARYFGGPVPLLELDF